MEVRLTPEERLINTSRIGPLVEHVYELANDGPTDVLDVDVFFLWPTRMRNGIRLFYCFQIWRLYLNLKCHRM